MSRQIGRTLELLELLAGHPHALALSDIATTLDLPKSTVSRMLWELVERGYVSQDEDTQRYRLTMRLVSLGFRHLNSTGLTDVAQPELDRLAVETGELARMTVVDDETLVWIREAQGARYGLRYDGNLGRTVNLTATATGKVWLATMTDEEAVAIALRAGFGEPGRTVGPRAVQSIPALLEEITATRARGYGLASEEGEPGVAAVAAAIPGDGPGARAVGTVSVAGPTARIRPADLDAFAPRVRAAAERLAEIWPTRRYQHSATPNHRQYEVSQ